MKRATAVLIGGPPATGKSTLATALAPEMGAALLDLDAATGPLTRVVSGLIGVRDLEDPVLAGLTRDARYDTLLQLADANLRAGLPVVLVAPFSRERAEPSAWAATARRLATDPTMVWLYLPPQELIRRLTRRALSRASRSRHTRIASSTLCCKKGTCGRLDPRLQISYICRRVAVGMSYGCNNWPV